MSSISPMQPSGPSSAGVRKRLMSPNIRLGGSCTFDVIYDESDSSVVEEIGMHTMKVSLSASLRQDCCIAYSSSRESGSEAVRCWSSWRDLASVLGNIGSLEQLIPHFSSRSDRLARDVVHMGRVECQKLIRLQHNQKH